MAASFFSARSKEIASLAKELDKHPERGLAFQNLPYKCRRRAASHHRNRIPSRARKSVGPLDPIGKRPSKKYRKRRSKVYRDKVTTKKRMVTHKWHAKRFHMSISNNWLVPLTANEKNFRAVYRAAHQGAYIEDLSYYQCVATESSKPVKLISWIDNENEETIGQVFQIQMSEGKSLIWTHPATSKQVLEAIQRSNSEATKCDKYCLFLLVGPLWVEKIGHFEEHVKVLKIADLPIFKNDENVSDEQVIVARLPGSIGFLLVVEKPSSYRLWLKFVHSKVVVGCQDSQEHLDVELERLTSSRLQQDIFTESRSHEQEELLKLANHWNKTETLSKFKINRNGLILRQYVKAFQKGKAVEKVSQMPSFIPIVIDMVNGGTLEPKSYLYFPSSPSSKADDKFTTDVLHAPFFKSPVIGIVTCTCYSLRRGVSSALGLLSQEAIDAYLNAGCDLQFKVAVEKEANGKFYVGKFRILTNDAGN